MRCLIGILGILAVLVAALSAADEASYLAAVRLSQGSAAATPMLRDHALGPQLSRAYAIQNSLVAVSMPRILGYKAGLTSHASQLRFGADGPVAGVLSADFAPTRTIRRADFGMLMLEVEIGFVLGEAIAEPLSEDADVSGYVDRVVAVIETPDLAFVRQGELTVADIVASNVAARGVIPGISPADSTAIALDDLIVVLTLNGAPVVSGSGRDAMDGQWRALRWLINRTLASGYELAPGQLLITGALGAMVPGRPGAYVADLGLLGQITFSVE